MDVEGFKEDDCMGVENFPLIGLVWGEGKHLGFSLRGIAPGCHLVCVLFWGLMGCLNVVQYVVSTWHCLLMYWG